MPSLVEILLFAVVFNGFIFAMIFRSEREQRELFAYWKVTDAIHRDLLQMGYVPGALFEGGKTRYDPKLAAGLLCYGTFMLPSREFIIEQYVKKA